MQTLFWGRSTIDLTYQVDGFPVENEKMFSDELLFQPGGPALNAAVTYSFLSGKCGLLSRVGKNINSTYIKDYLVNRNIELLDLEENEDFYLPTSSIYVNSKSGSRTIVNSPKVNSSDLKDDIWVLNDLQRIEPEIVFIDGYELENKFEYLKKLKSKGSKIVFDGGSWKNNSEEYLQVVDFAICSDRFRMPGKNLEETIIGLTEFGINKIAFTNGEKTITTYEYGRRSSIKVPQINAVDTLGAGDVFHGAFCHYYRLTENFIDSLMKSAEIASESCKHLGTHTWQNYFQKN